MKIIDERKRRYSGEGKPVIGYEVLLDFENGRDPEWYMLRDVPGSTHRRSCGFRARGIPPLTTDTCLCRGLPLKTDYGQDRDMVRMNEDFLNVYEQIAGNREYVSIHERLAL